jgi:hypothetical protein
MVVAWLLFPLVLLAVCIGCGLLVERVAGWHVPGALLPSVGLALVIVTASLSTDNSTTAPLSTAMIVVLALAGYASSRQRLRALRPERWALAVGLGVFAVCAAPMVLSGNATFLGYLVLNDLSYHFALVDQLLTHGHDLAGLAHSSSYFGVLHQYLSTSYPTGAQVALGAVRPLVGQDIAWIFQPYLAVILALGGVALHELLRDVVHSRALRAACAFIAAQAGLVYAYYLQASVKELATTWIITVTVVLVFATLRRQFSLRSVIPLLIATVAGLDLLDLAIVPWLAPPLAAFMVVVAWRERHHIGAGIERRRLAVASAGGALVFAALAAPVIGGASTSFNTVTYVLTQKNDLGNLVGPLLKWQMLGIWPVGDYRFPVTTHYRITYALLGVALASTVLGALWTLRRRASAPLLLLAGNGIATVYLLSRGSPYANAKVMMIFSLTVVLIAMLGAAALHDVGRRFEGWALAAVIGAGVLWTNGLAYHGASIAPRDRLAELASIGSRFSGRGPAFFNVSDEYEIHFLRSEAPVNPVWQAPVTRPGLVRTQAQLYAPWDPDDLAPSYLQSFPLLVIARSPLASRPPADYSLAYQGRFYEVWQRTSSPQILEHTALGAGLSPAAVPSCRLVLATAARAAYEHARVAYVQRTNPPTFTPPPGAGAGTISVDQTGPYQVWLGGEISQRLQIWVGGRKIGSVAYEVERPGQFVRVGEVTLSRGNAPVNVVRASNDLRPGDGHVDYLWPLVLVRDPSTPAVGQIEPQHARSLCGRSLDWIEIVR